MRDEGSPSEVATCSGRLPSWLDAAHHGLLVLDSDLPGQDVFKLHEHAHALPAIPNLWVASVG